MNMATSELQRSDHAHCSLHLERVETVAADETVRHVDQLETETLAAFYATLVGDRPIPVSETDLEPGEVVVFTDYYRVESV